nr:hypothetical protein [Tanacetum cinerariifolium]GEV87234.1 hypothetical protein [Tanacetum cinerariifolium]
MLGVKVRNGKSWTNMKTMMTKELCPPEEIQRMKSELWNLKVKDYDIIAYTTRFNELVLLCPKMVTTEKKKIGAYICGLSDNIKGEVTSSSPTTLNSAVRMAHTLMEQKRLAKAERDVEGKKRKWENFQSRTGTAPKCNRCGLCHFDNYLPKCTNCGKMGHKARDCRFKTVATGANGQLVVHYYDYGERGHKSNKCLKKNNHQGRNVIGRAYAMREVEQNPDLNVVTGKFLLNNCYARVLFDSRSNSFVNTSFSHLIDIEPVRQNTSYEVELADGRIVSPNTVLKGCILNLVDHLFEINLMSIELGTFDEIIRMDKLVERDAVIVCGKKVVHIPIKGKMLVAKGIKVRLD